MNEQTKSIAKAIGIYFEPSRENRVHSISTDTLNKFAEAIAQNCIFEMVHESTTYPAYGHTQDFTVRVVDRIKNKFGIEK